jgi:hypothetical protein
VAKTTRKKVRKTKKAAPRRKTLKLRAVKADLGRAIEALGRRGAPESAQARLRQALTELEQFCNVEQGCPKTMAVPLS